MKKTSMAAFTLIAGSAMLLMAQTSEPSDTQPMGRGRGGAPFAWNDKDKDGICDITGKPVGQARGAAGQRMGRGRGNVANAWNDADQDGICDITGQPVGRGFAAGRGRGAGFSARQQTAAAQQP